MTRGMIPQSLENKRMTRTIGKYHPVMDRQKPDERCGLRRKKQSYLFRAMFQHV